MTLDEFVQIFAEQFDDTSADSFTPETNYRELEEWGSLVALAVIAMIDDEFEKRATGADLKSCKTIRELYELIQSK